MSIGVGGELSDSASLKSSATLLNSKEIQRSWQMEMSSRGVSEGGMGAEVGGLMELR